MHTFVTIIVLIVMLGILLASHEFGHLIVAKGFNVYCLEYSIGFGPKLFSKRFKNGETAYSLRAIPLGGYVSMYGEGTELEEGEVLPPERSVNGVKPWKQALIFSAGIFMNFFLAIAFTFIYALCFPNSYQSQVVYSGYDQNGNVLEGDQIVLNSQRSYSLWASGSIDGYEISVEEDRIFSPGMAKDGNLNERGFIVDAKTATIDGEPYVALFTPASVSSTALFDGLSFYPVDESAIVTKTDSYLGIERHADFTRGPHALEKGDEVAFSITVISDENKVKGDRLTNEDIVPEKRNEHRVEFVYGETEGPIPGSAIRIETLEYWPPFADRFALGCQYLANFFQSIGLGLASLFTFNFEQLGSIVAMGGVLSQTSVALGWGRTFFFYGGFISLNLAIFNLVPIPGLDGWQLLVLGVEKVFKRKIPDKVKAIMSWVGLGLLMVFGVGIIIRDILGLF